jgi:plasmid stability protein
MGTLTIRNLPDDVHDKLRLRAAKNRRSVEAEARDLLAKGVTAGDQEVGAWMGALRGQMGIIGDWSDSDREVEQLFEDSINNPDDPLYAKPE